MCFTNVAHATSGFSAQESVALLDYAKACLLAQIDGKTAPPPPEFATKIQRPCFVTFFADRRVFACFGGFAARRVSLADEVADNVRMAWKNDARSRNISREKVLNAGVQITFPSGPLEHVSHYSLINPASEGMFVESASSGVAFVPGEARTAGWAFREALRRLGEKDPTGVNVYRFRAQAVSTKMFPPSPAREERFKEYAQPKEHP